MNKKRIVFHAPLKEILSFNRNAPFFRIFHKFDPKRYVPTLFGRVSPGMSQLSLKIVAAGELYFVSIRAVDPRYTGAYRAFRPDRLYTKKGASENLVGRGSEAS